jgi:drug/metabolite transporter (DMT)-like permease
MEQSEEPIGAHVVVVLAVAVAAISSAAVLVRGAGEVPAITIAMWRTTAVGGGLLPFVLVPWILRANRTGIQRPNPKDTGLTILSGACLAGHFVCWFAAIQQTTIMRATVLVCTAPIWTGVLEWLLFAEKPSRRYWAGLTVALAGVAWMSGSLGEGDWRGDTLAAMGGLLAAIYLLFGRSIRKRVSIQAYACWVCVAAALWLWPAALVSDAKITGFSTTSWLMIAALAIGPQMLGHNGFNYALKYITAASVSVLMLLEPAGATLLAYLAFGEVPALSELSGAALAVLGVLAATWKTKKPKPPQSNASGANVETHPSPSAST